MKSVTELGKKLSRQWFSADLRERRFAASYEWPIRMVIGKPKASDIKNHLSLIQKHLRDWRDYDIGRVEWDVIKYQSATSAIELPVYWLLESLQDWVEACQDRQIIQEYRSLQQIINQVEPIFHKNIIRQRHLWQSSKLDSDIKNVIHCCQLAMKLEKGMARGLPLRSLSFAGLDTKFIEVNHNFLIQLLNIRFADNAIKAGSKKVIHESNSLESFLGAPKRGEHWLLVKPLAENILPFEQLRIRSSELMQTELAADNLLIVENEQCHHLLPQINNCIAILGGGLDVNWLCNENFRGKRLYYWGDIDTWGLKILAMARSHQPEIRSIMMNLEVYNLHQNLAVPEPETAGIDSPYGLKSEEIKLYQTLLQSDNGRLEQERIPKQVARCYLLEAFAGDNVKGNLLT